MLDCEQISVETTEMTIADLQPYLSSSELKNRYRLAAERVESRRWHLLWLVSQKWTIKQAATVVGLNSDYALDLVKASNQKGFTAITNGYKRSKKRPAHALLNSQQLEKLRIALKNVPPDKGLGTGPKVAQWIASETGREKVRPPRGWDYLKKCGYSLKSPRPHHQKGNQVEQEEFKKNGPTESEKFNSRILWLK